MTVEWYDLGQRLAAQQTGDVIDRLIHSPVNATAMPVAVRARRQGRHTVVAAATATAAPRPCTDLDALRMLAGLGVRITAPQPATLVTDDAGTLRRLVALAQAAPDDGLAGEAAAHIGWWADRGDFPGSSAVIRVPEVCTQRWVTGAAPDAERLAVTWQNWLGEPDDLDGMLAILERLHQGPRLPRLAEVVEDDTYTWGEAVRTHSEGWNWRRPDPMSRAAFGLRARCDAADLWTAALLDDPLYRHRAIHTGHVVTGTVTLNTANPNGMTVTCDRLDARLRSGASIIGFPTHQPGAARFSGSIISTGIEHGLLGLNLCVTPATRPTAGQHVTVLPAPPNPHQKRNGRMRYRGLYSTRSSWLTTGRIPVPQRRDVPLDVLFASADDD